MLLVYDVCTVGWLLCLLVGLWLLVGWVCGVGSIGGLMRERESRRHTTTRDLGPVYSLADCHTV